jgi:hypothetical protein
MSKKLDHALHNEKVSNLLCCDTANVDWIITTAFYAAIHFVDHKIFPIREKTTDGKSFKIKNFDEYYAINYPTKNKDKHTARLDLVRVKVPTIAADYAWLKSTCWTARYSDYKFNNEQDFIDKVKIHLEKIKKCCTS